MRFSPELSRRLLTQRNALLKRPTSPSTRELFHGIFLSELGATIARARLVLSERLNEQLEYGLRTFLRRRREC